MNAPTQPYAVNWTPIVIEAGVMTLQFARQKAMMLGMFTVLMGFLAFLFCFAPFATVAGYGEPGDNALGQAAFGAVAASLWVLLARAAIARARRLQALERLNISIGGGAVMLRVPDREATVMMHDIARVAVRADRARGLVGMRTVYTSAIGLADGSWIDVGVLTGDALGKLLREATAEIAHARGVVVEDLVAAVSAPTLVAPGDAARL